jgi:single-stranded DNA-binding protein
VRHDGQRSHFRYALSRAGTAHLESGQPFVTATLKAKDGEIAQWWKVLAFSESVQAELMRLTDGDALSVQGGLKAETYEKDGATKLSLSVVADHVLALRQPPKARRERERQVAGATQQKAPFDDTVPF